MISDTGVISIANQTVGQVQLITNEDGSRRAQLYSKSGIFLADTPFTGNDDVGYEHGLSLFNGYVAGWNNCEFNLSKAVSKALNTKSELEMR